MPRSLTPEEKKERQLLEIRVKQLIEEAGGLQAIARYLTAKHPKNPVEPKTVTDWSRRGSIPDRYFLDLVGMTKRPPSYLKPRMYNKRHPVFKEHYSGVPKNKPTATA